MRNLLGRLHDRSTYELDLIARWWEVELRGRDRAANAGHLYRVLTDAWSFAIAWERLSPTDRVVLEMLADDAGDFSAAQIAEHLGASTDAVQPALTRLYQAGLLYAEPHETLDRPAGESRFFLPREIAHLTVNLRREQERGVPNGEGAARLLDRLSDGALVDIAEHMGRQIIPALALRPDLIAFVEPRLGDPDRVRDSVRSLNPTAARLWRWLLDRSEPAAPGQAGRELRLSLADLRQAVQSLGQRGLLWRGYAADGSLRLVAPELLRHPQPRPEPPLPDLVLIADAEVAPLDWLYPYAAAWDLLTVLRAVNAGQLRRAQDAESSSPALRRLAAGLWRKSGDLPPTGYVPFLLHLATGLGLVRPDGPAAGIEVERERVRRWSGLTFPEQARRLVDIWRQTSSWPEGDAREALQLWGADWPSFRSRLLSGLAELTGERWVTVESFAARLAASSPDALGPHFTAAASHEPSDQSPEARRSAVLRLAIEITVTTACDWLGLVALGSSRRTPVMRLSPVGDALVHDRPPVEGEPLGDHPLVVQPDFEVLLFQPSPRRVWALSAFAELAALDRVSSYRLTRQGIERGLVAGLTVGQMTGFLEQQAGARLPQNVVFEIEQWAREFRRVRTRAALVLEPDVRGSAGQLADALQAEGLRVELLPRDRLLVLVPEGDDVEQWQRALEERLRALGQTPVRHGA